MSRNLLSIDILKHYFFKKNDNTIYCFNNRFKTIISILIIIPSIITLIWLCGILTFYIFYEDFDYYGNTCIHKGKIKNQICCSRNDNIDCFFVGFLSLFGSGFLVLLVLLILGTIYSTVKAGLITSKNELELQLKIKEYV